MTTEDVCVWFEGTINGRPIQHCVKCGAVRVLGPGDQPTCGPWSATPTVAVPPATAGNEGTAVGDVVQIAPGIPGSRFDGHLGFVREVHGWGLKVVFRCFDRTGSSECHASFDWPDVRRVGPAAYPRPAGDETT